eukprot:5424013-Ditylum_brightwellii.AAC.1
MSAHGYSGGYNNNNKTNGKLVHERICDFVHAVNSLEKGHPSGDLDHFTIQGCGGVMVKPHPH